MSFFYKALCTSCGSLFSLSHIPNKCPKCEEGELSHIDNDIANVIICMKLQIENANEDAARLADELKEALNKLNVVWEEAGESSPALILHEKRVGNV